MKTLRIMFSVVLLLVFVGVVGIGSLLFFIDPNKLKPVIAEQVQKRTGYGLVIDGQFSWSFYPRIGIKVDHMMLYSPKQTSAFMDLHGVIFVTELDQLLHGKQALRGDIYVAEVKLLQAQATNAHVGLNWKDDVLTLKPMTATFYNGEMSGLANGKTLTTIPQWDWNFSFKNVQIKPLLQDINGLESKLQIAGLGNLTFQANTQGKNQEQMLSNLNGAIAYNLTNGVLEGVDFNYLLKSADAVISKQPLTTPTNLNQTAFESLLGSANIKNGLTEFNVLTVTSPTFVTRAHGTINLPYQAVNLQLLVTPQNEMKTQWAIPVMVTGSLSRPDIRLDLTEINMMMAKDELSAAKSKVKEEVKRHISGKAGEFLSKVIGQ